MTPRITKSIAKAFYKVRHPSGSKMRKVMNKIKLMEHIDDLERRRDIRLALQEWAAEAEAVQRGSEQRGRVSSEQ